jgi:hypothetical protein
MFPEARLNALTPTTLERAQAKFGAEGRTPQTVNRYMAFLRRVLNKAVRDGHLPHNPVSRIKMFRESIGKPAFSRRRRSGCWWRLWGQFMARGLGWPS